MWPSGECSHSKGQNNWGSPGKKYYNSKGYGFVELRSEEDADYSIKIMHMVKLFGKPIKVNKV